MFAFIFLIAFCRYSSRCSHKCRWTKHFLKCKHRSVFYSVLPAAVERYVYRLSNWRWCVYRRLYKSFCLCWSPPLPKRMSKQWIKRTPTELTNTCKEIFITIYFILNESKYWYLQQCHLKIQQTRQCLFIHFYYDYFL